VAVATAHVWRGEIEAGVTLRTLLPQAVASLAFEAPEEIQWFTDEESEEPPLPEEPEEFEEPPLPEEPEEPPLPEELDIYFRGAKKQRRYGPTATTL